MRKIITTRYLTSVEIFAIKDFLKSTGDSGDEKVKFNNNYLIITMLNLIKTFHLYFYDCTQFFVNI